MAEKKWNNMRIQFLLPLSTLSPIKKAVRLWRTLLLTTPDAPISQRRGLSLLNSTEKTLWASRIYRTEWLSYVAHHFEVLTFGFLRLSEPELRPSG